MRRRLHVARVQPGDGSPLPRYRFWQLFTRSLFFVEIPDETGRRHVYEVDVRHGADSTTRRSPASLYRDGRQVHRANGAVAFPVPGGVIEVATSQYGVKRMHLVADDGAAHPLTPDPRSTEARRARFERRFPLASAVVGWVGMVVLLVGAVVGLAEAAESVTRAEPVARYVGTVVSPFALPWWAVVALAVAVAAAGVERGLRMRSTWLAQLG